eukprot:gene46561-57019_t
MPVALNSGRMPGLLGDGEHDVAVGGAVGDVVIVGEVAAGVEEPPLAFVADHGVRGVEDVAVGFARGAAGEHGGAVGPLPMDAVFREAALYVDALGGEAIVTEQADATFVGVGDGEVVKLEVGGVLVRDAGDGHAGLATQNPIETEGTYPLPEAQVDRFMMKVMVDYPTDEEEFVIVERVTGPAVQVKEVFGTASANNLYYRLEYTHTDGVLREHLRMPPHVAPVVVSRIKVM